MTLLARRVSASAMPAGFVLAAAAALWALGTPRTSAALFTLVATLLLAAATWALADLERFVLVGVLCAMTLPHVLLAPGGARVAAADVLLVLAFAAWLARRALGKAPGLQLADNRLLAPALLYAGVTAASLAWSTDTAATLKSIVQTTEIVVAIPLLYAALPSSLRRIREGLFAFVAATSVLAVVTFSAFALRAAQGDLSPQYLPGLHKNAIGAFLAVGLVLAFTLALERGVPARRRRLLYLAGAVELAGLGASFARGALLGALVACVVAALVLRRHRLRTLALFIAAAVALAAALLPRTVADASSGGYSSSSVRVYSYANGVEKIREAPLLGTGAGTYWDEIPELQIGLADPNNLFLLTWAELGIGGLAALLLVLAATAGIFRRARRLPEPAKIVAIACAAGALSRLVHFQFDATWTRGTASICFALLGLALAAIRLGSRPASGHARPA